MVPPVFVSASDELKNKTVCEDHELKLHCHESKFLNIYSATYGRKTQERDVCSSEATWLPPFGMCLYVAVVRVLSEEISVRSLRKEATRWLVPGLEGKSRAGGNHPPGSCLPLPHILESVCCSVSLHRVFTEHLLYAGPVVSMGESSATSTESPWS